MTSISRSTLLSLATLALMAAGSFGCGGTMGPLIHVSRSVDDTVEVMRGRADAPIAVTANALRLQVDATPQCELAEVQQVESDSAYEREYDNSNVAGFIVLARMLAPDIHHVDRASNLYDDTPSEVSPAPCPATRAGLHINLLEEITGVMGEARLVALDLASDRGAVDLLPDWRALIPLAQRSGTLTVAVSRTDRDARRILSTMRIPRVTEEDLAPGSGDRGGQSTAWQSLNLAALAAQKVRIPARDVFSNSGDRIAESLDLALCANDPCDAMHDLTDPVCELSARECGNEVAWLLRADYLGLSATWRQRLVAASERAHAVINRVRAARDAALADREAQRQALAEQLRVAAAEQAQQMALRRAEMEEEAAREGRAEAAAANARAASRAAEQASRLNACLARCPGERSACERVCSRVH